MPILIRDVRLIDGLADRPREHQDVLVDGERIVDIRDRRAVPGPDASRGVDGVASPASPTIVIDGAGRTLLPGLIDAHAHYTFDPTQGSLQVIARRTDEEILERARDHASLALRAGVTAARGAGSIRNLECRLRDEIAAGATPGPRLVAAGTAVGAPDGHGIAFGVGAAGAPALAEVTGRVIAGGADVVKVVASEAAMLTTTGHEPGRMVHGAPELTEAELRSIVDMAAGHGRSVMSHAQDAESVRRSAVAGVRSVEHAWLADEWAIEAMAAAGAWLVPTLVVTDVNRDLPDLDPVQRERQDLIERRHRASTEAAIRLGLPLATGTDTGEVGVTADLVWREIALLHDHGASAMAAIQAATSSAALLLGVAGETGSIEVGKAADLVLVAGDPLADLGRLALPLAVIRAGRLVPGVGTATGGDIGGVA